MTKFPFVLLSGVLAAAVVMGGPSASAETKRFDDPVGDAPARFDVSKVVYRNQQASVSVTLVVPELERRGAARLEVGSAAGGDGFWVAQVKVGVDGGLHKEAFIEGPGSHVPVTCSFGASWNASADTIAIVIPWPCIARTGGSYFGPGAVYLDAYTGRHRDDLKPARYIRRG